MSGPRTTIIAYGLFALLFMWAIISVSSRDAEGAEPAVWRGLVVAEESRCSPYRRSDYRYSPKRIERALEARHGALYTPYTGSCWGDRGETTVEHVVALSEAHDSGLCSADRGTRTRFANDMANLTLARPDINKSKGGRDAAEWMPEENRCWFAATVVGVRRAYGLTVDRAEAEALEAVLDLCASTRIAMPDCARAGLSRLCWTP